MEDWVPAVISGASGIFGAAVGGGATYAIQRADTKDRQRGELVRALQRFSYALDALHLRIIRLPKDSRLSRFADSAINEKRTPSTNHFVGWLQELTIARPTHQALGRFNAAQNDLAPIAPNELLPILERANALLARIDERDDAWAREWIDTRGELLRLSRSLAASRRRRSLRRPFGS